MSEYSINVSKIEDLQMIKDLVELDQIFVRAQSMVIQGGIVYLSRENADGSIYNFEEITTEDDLKNYKESVYKYL